MTPVIRFEHVSKHYHKRGSVFSRRDLFAALEDVSFEVRAGEAIGMAGPNGAGKTTLMRLAAGITGPTHGRVSIRGRVMPLLGMEGCLQHSMNAVENARFLLSLHLLGQAEKNRLLPRILEFSGLDGFYDMPVHKYSNGMRSRLSFSIAAHLPSEILLVDEALSVGDKEFQEKSRAKIAEFLGAGRTIFFASHSLPEMRQITSRVLWMDKGALVADGPAGDVLDRYQAFRRP